LSWQIKEPPVDIVCFLRSSVIYNELQDINVLVMKEHSRITTIINALNIKTEPKITYFKKKIEGEIDITKYILNNWNGKIKDAIIKLRDDLVKSCKASYFIGKICIEYVDIFKAITEYGQKASDSLNECLRLREEEGKTAKPNLQQRLKLYDKAKFKIVGVRAMCEILQDSFTGEARYSPTEINNWMKVWVK